MNKYSSSNRQHPHKSIWSANICADDKNKRTFELIKAKIMNLSFNSFNCSIYSEQFIFCFSKNRMESEGSVWTSLFDKFISTYKSAISRKQISGNKQQVLTSNHTKYAILRAEWLILMSLFRCPLINNFFCKKVR